MFIGEYVHSIDSKGRAIVPAKFREELGVKFYITHGLETCLALYTKEAWETLVRKLNSLPSTNRKAMAYRRFTLSSAFECEPDGNGRIMIPSKLRESAGITKEIVSAGNGDIVEIWDKDKWEEYNSSYNFDDESLEALSEFGI